jgi:hypothetical protein
MLARARPALRDLGKQPIDILRRDVGDLASAPFAPDEIAVTAEQNVLSIEGRKAEAAK